ncbi:Integrase catalytic core, partial [Macrophomina phaseolina MS6]
MYTPFDETIGFFSPLIQAVGPNDDIEKTQGQMILSVPSLKVDINIFHRRMGHAHFRACRTLARQLGYQLTGQQEHCETCALSKSQRRIGHESQPRETDPGDCFHGDTVKVSTPGLKGERYYLLLTDDATDFRWGYPYNRKHQAFNALTEHLEMWKTQTGQYPRKLRIDAGTEFAVTQLEVYCKKRGIKLELSTPYTPEQNGKSEKSNHITETRIRAMLQGANLPFGLWPEALNTAIKIVNRTPTRINENNKTPFQSISEKLKLSQALPNLSNWRTFGCTAYVHVPHQRRTAANKFQLRAQKGKLVGYEGDTIYRIYLPAKHMVIRSSHVTFNEADIDLPTLDPEDVLDEQDELSEYVSIPLDSEGEVPVDIPHPREESKTIETSQPEQMNQEQLQEIARQALEVEPQIPTLGTSESDSEPLSFEDASEGTQSDEEQDQQQSDHESESTESQSESDENPEPELRRSSRERYQTEKGKYNQRLVESRKGKRGPIPTTFTVPPILAYSFTTGLQHSLKIADLPPEPKTWEEAMKHPLKDQWLQGAHKEIAQHTKNGTWR